MKRRRRCCLGGRCLGSGIVSGDGGGPHLLCSPRVASAPSGKQASVKWAREKARHLLIRFGDEGNKGIISKISGKKARWDRGYREKTSETRLWGGTKPDKAVCHRYWMVVCCMSSCHAWMQCRREKLAQTWPNAYSR